MSSVDLEICDKKCELYCPSGHTRDFPTPVSHDGMIILGTPVGKPDFVRAHCVDIAKAGDRLYCEMLKLNNWQSSMLILRHCHVPRLNYLARQVFPCDLEEARIIHDELTKRTFMGIIGFSHLNDTAWKQAALKIRFGEFGLTQVRQISHAAYLYSWCQTMNKLPSRSSSMSDLINYLKESESVPESIGSTLKSAFQLLPQLPKSVDNESEENQSIEDFISYPQKLQYRLCTKIASSEVGDLLAHVPSDRDAARLRSLQGKGAESWLEVIPSSGKHALN